MKSGWLPSASAIAFLVIAACGGGETEGPQVDALELVTAALADVRLNEPVDVTLQAKGGVAPYTFSATGLPAGLAISGAKLSGAATAPGRAMISLSVTDKNSTTVSKTLELYVIPDPLMIVTTSIPAGKEGTAYAQTLLATGGIPPLAWTLGAGALPGGLMIERTGSIAGTPTEFGVFNFTVRVSDGEDAVRDQPLTLTLGALNPMITTSTLARARVGAAYEATLEAEGGEPPYTYSIASGALPAGVMLGADGTIEGTPADGGSFTFSVLVTDSSMPARTDMAQLSINVIAALSIQTTQISQVLRGRTFAFQMTAAGGVAPYTWSLGAGRPPMGITFDSQGVFSGMSTEVGEHPLTIRVRDAEGFQRSGSFTVRVSDRFTYESEIDVMAPPAIPAICTSTQTSYVTVPIVIPDSFQIADLNVNVDITYSWNENAQANIRNRSRTPGTPRIVLFAPDGSQAPLCGNGAAIPGGPECDAQTDMVKDWDDEGAQANRPERPLSVFDGINAQGTWLLAVGIAEPRCMFTGTINAVTLSIQDDRAPDPYVVVRGYRKNNLVSAPFVRSCTPNCGSGMVENELFLDARLYDVGNNGYPEAGLGDDADLGVAFTWVWDGTPLAGVTLDPDGHVTVGNSSQTGCQQGRCAGTGQRVITGSGGGHSVDLTLRVLPPEWNPQVREY